jgi:NADH-quinone oxidoreductase subunit L
MFRLWYMTFAGEPRNKHRYEHAHESPPVMYWPLIVLAAFAFAFGWPVFRLANGLLEQARPVGTVATTMGELLTSLKIPGEHLSHIDAVKVPAGLAAFTAAASGLLLATIIYLWRMLDVNEIRQAAPFRQLYGWLWNKWYFDELYWAVFVKPTHWIAALVAKFDRGLIDEILHGAAAICRGTSQVFGKLLDGIVVDGSVNALAHGTWDFGLLLRRIQTGSIRQYVLFIALGTWLICLAAIVVVITTKA